MTSPIIITTDDAIEAMRVDPSGNVGIGTATPTNALHVNSVTGLRQNSLYMSGDVGGSSVTYNAHRNATNDAWVFPDPTHTAVTIEIDDFQGSPRFQVWSTTTGNPTGWEERFAIDGNSGNISANGSLAIGSNLTASTVTAGSINANGEVLVNNASGTETVVLDGNGAMIEVGASGADGVITVYDKSHTAVCTINAGKINAKVVKASGSPIAIFGGANQAGAIAVLAQSHGNVNNASLGTDAFAGDFTGNVNISGNLSVTGSISKHGGGFKIDHPLDPANKYLAHSFVESPDMKNIYDGVAVLDANGEAVVELPEWFAALNRDLRYQLTCIGDYAPVYIAQKVRDNRFKIAGGKPEMEVSWQVTGIRQDAWACAHRFCTEEEKSPAEQGYYLHPEENGADAAMNIQQIHRSQAV
jgi:hypothetical protein